MLDSLSIAFGDGGPSCARSVLYYDSDTTELGDAGDGGITALTTSALLVSLEMLNRGLKVEALAPPAFIRELLS